MDIQKSYLDNSESSLELFCTKKQKLLKRESIILSDDRMDCLIPIKIDKLPFRTTRISYDLTGTISLRKFLPHIIFSKRMFIRLIRNTIQSYKNIRHLKFNMSNLIYSVDRLFIDPRNWKIGFIYVVADPFFGSDNIIDLLSEIACNCVFDNSENISFADEFFSLLSSADSVFDVEQFLNYLEDESNIFGGTVVCCSSCGSPIGPKDSVCPLCGRSITRNSKNIIGKQDFGNVKAFLNDGMRNIPVNSFPFTIGKNELNSLVIPKGKISRSHAQINVDNNDYYLVDLNSTNGTYIGGEKIFPGEKYHLKNNTEIEFVDEKFLFILK